MTGQLDMSLTVLVLVAQPGPHGANLQRVAKIESRAPEALFVKVRFWNALRLQWQRGRASTIAEEEILGAPREDDPRVIQIRIWCGEGYEE